MGAAGFSGLMSLAVGERMGRQAGSCEGYLNTTSVHLGAGQETRL